MFTIETKRLKLRELNENDENFLYDILSDEETMKYYPAPYDINRVRKSIKRSINSYKENRFGLWGVILKEQNRFIGQCGITKQDIDGVIVPEIGYHINKEFWRKGFASEASVACLKYGFEKLQLIEIYIHTYIKNIPSRRVAEKLNMVRVKEFEKYIKDYNIYMKHVVYKMDRKQFRNLKKIFVKFSS
ncbi:MAG: GNAT family N-acetyltransferase [Ignavibacteriaceae bacterium]